MSPTLQPGELAPDFDLASTEDAMLMLRDEVPRTPVLLYLFSESNAERAKADLAALKEGHASLAKAEVKVLAISPLGLDELKKVQAELALPFPLLHDDRKLAAAYGLAGPEDEVGSEAIAVLVGRDQKVLWIEDPAPPMEEGVAAALAALPGVSSTVNYPRKVINRLVDRWVN